MTNEQIRSHQEARNERMREARIAERERYELELERLVSYQEALQDVKTDIMRGLK